MSPKFLLPKISFLIEVFCALLQFLYYAWFIYVKFIDIGFKASQVVVNSKFKIICADIWNAQFIAIWNFFLDAVAHDIETV